MNPGGTTSTVVMLLVYLPLGVVSAIVHNRLYNRLERFHKDKIETLNLPKRDGIGYISTPVKAKNFFSFLFSSEYFQDEELKKRKRICKNMYIISFFIMLLVIIILNSVF